jgi:hypothetical protein
VSTLASPVSQSSGGVYMLTVDVSAVCLLPAAAAGCWLLAAAACYC